VPPLPGPTMRAARPATLGANSSVASNAPATAVVADGAALAEDVADFASGYAGAAIAASVVLGVLALCVLL